MNEKLPPQEEFPPLFDYSIEDRATDPHFLFENGGQFTGPQPGERFTLHDDAPEGVDLPLDMLGAVIDNCVAANSNTIDQAVATGGSKSIPLYMPNIAYDEDGEPASASWGNGNYSLEGDYDGSELDVIADICNRYGLMEGEQILSREVTRSNDGVKTVFDYTSNQLDNGWRIELVKVERIPLEEQGIAPDVLAEMLERRKKSQLPLEERSEYRELWLSPPRTSHAYDWHADTSGKGDAAQAVRNEEAKNRLYQLAMTDTQPLLVSEMFADDDQPDEWKNKQKGKP